MHLQKECNDKTCHTEEPLQIAAETVRKDDDDRETCLSQKDQTVPADVLVFEDDEEKAHRLLSPRGGQVSSLSTDGQERSQ